MRRMIRVQTALVLLTISIAALAVGEQDKVPDEVKKSLGHPHRMEILNAAECATTTSRIANKQCAAVDLSQMNHSVDVVLARIRVPHRPVLVSRNPDIIVKLYSEDQMYDSEITLTVYDANTNEVIYQDKRTLVEINNDTIRLLTNLLKTLQRAKQIDQEIVAAEAAAATAAEAQRKEELAQQQAEAQKTAELEKGEELYEAQFKASSYAIQNCVSLKQSEARRQAENKCWNEARGVYQPEFFGSGAEALPYQRSYVTTCMSEFSFDLLNASIECQDEIVPAETITYKGKAYRILK